MAGFVILKDMNGDQPAAPPQAGVQPEAKAPEQPAPAPEQPAEPQPQTVETVDGPDPFGDAEVIDAPDPKGVAWDGPEFVGHDKSPKWYWALMGASVALAVLVFLITKDVISAITIVVVGGMLAFIGGRKPKMIPYQIDRNGIAIGEKQFPYEHFRSYAVMREANQPSIALHPLQRFKPLINMYYAPEHEEAILDALNEHLPAEERDHDYIDRFLGRIKL